MDQYIKQSIDARKDAIFATYDVGAESKKEINSLFSEIEKLGAECKDVGEFEAEFTKSPLNQKYLNLFTKVATNSKAKTVTRNDGGDKGDNGAAVGKMVAEGTAEGIAESAMDQMKREVLPTRASINQAGHDAMQKVPILGDALDIGAKASYAAHIGKLFKSRKKKDEKGKDA